MLKVRYFTLCSLNPVLGAWFCRAQYLAPRALNVLTSVFSHRTGTAQGIAPCRNRL